MKKIYTLLMTVVTVAALYAQAPSKFSYQAVVRNSSGVVVPNGTSVSFRFTIHDGSSGGTILYQETQSKTTNNAFGLVNLEIGAGTVQQGAYPNASQWSSGAKFLQVEVDPAGGSSFTDLGATQISAVPYANFAGSASGITGTITPSQISSGSASNGQVLQWNGSNWVPATVSGGGGGDITGVIAGTGLSGGGTSGDVTLNATNATAMWNADKIQGINVTAGATNGQFLKFNGSSWISADDNNTTYSAGTGLSLSGTTFNSVWTTSGNNIYNNNSGFVGIGVNAPLALLHTKGGSEVNRWEFNSSGWNSIYSGSSYLGYLGVYNSAAEIDFGTSGSGTKLNLVTGATPRLTVSGNKVGIGTRSPNAILQVSAEDNSQFVINGSKIAFDSANTTFDDSGAFLIHSSLELGVGHIVSLAAMGSDNGNYSSEMTFYTRGGSDPAERMRIRSNGNVGIGTKSPSYMLDIAGTTRSKGNMFAGNKLSVGSTLTPNHMSMVYGTNSTGIALTQYVSSTTGAGSSNGLLVGHNDLAGEGLVWNFENQDLVFGTNSTERMKIENTGEVGIGTTTPGTQLEVKSDRSSKDWNVLIAQSTTAYAGLGLKSSNTYGMNMYGVATATGGMNLANSTGSWAPIGASAFNVSSDRTLKKEIHTIENGEYPDYLNQIRNIESATYRYNWENNETRPFSHVGFMAQTLPQTTTVKLTENPDGTGAEKIGYNLSDMIGLSIIGIKAVDHKTLELEKKVSDLEGQIQVLMNEINQLKAAQK